MILDRFQQFGGSHSEFAALTNAMAYQGIRDAESGAPLTEALLFGIGSGIGMSYFSFHYEGYAPTLSINVTGRYKAKYGAVLQRTATRLGLEPRARTSNSAKVALAHLKAGLSEGKPVIVEMMADLPSLPLHPYERFAEHAMVVYGIDDARRVAYLADRASRPVQMPLELLSAARAAFNPLKNFSLTVEPAAIDLPAALRQGIKHTAGSLINPPTPKRNFGLNALLKWAELMVDQGDRGWQAAFQPGSELFAALASVFAQIEMIGDGGAMRGTYARFLDAAGSRLALPDLTAAAGPYREIAQLWTQLAESVLPDEVPTLAKAKTLMRQKRALYQAEGGEAADGLGKIHSQQAEIQAAAAAAFPLSRTQRQALFDSLRDQILVLHQKETKAAETLSALTTAWSSSA